jgi:hypothetical protein
MLLDRPIPKALFLEKQRTKIGSRFCVATASGLPTECLAIVPSNARDLAEGIESKTPLSRNPQLLLTGVATLRYLFASSPRRVNSRY